MGNHEIQPLPGEQPETEILAPGHFYAAYVFDRANERETDIGAILEQASALGYAVRYWWLSDAMELQGFPDRLIVCVHHPSGSEDAGMDLYNALKEKEVDWDDLEAAAVDEYWELGKSVKELGDILSPCGYGLFPQDTSQGEHVARKEEALYTITEEDILEEARKYLNRELPEEERLAVVAKFRKALEYLDWLPFMDVAIQQCQKAGQVRPAAEEPPEVDNDTSGSV
ncbi:MAG: hypothetical protein JW862_18330 [Anaerolineales bacterium]|nr:hypothetical protein [Anaerolineales bacterium]